MESLVKYSTENWVGNDRYRGFVRLIIVIPFFQHGFPDNFYLFQSFFQSLCEIISSTGIN